MPITGFTNIHRMDRTKHTLDPQDMGVNLLSFRPFGDHYVPNTFNFAQILPVESNGLDPENFSQGITPINTTGVIIRSVPSIPPTIPPGPWNITASLDLVDFFYTLSCNVTYPQYTTVVVDIDGEYQTTFPPNTFPATWSFDGRDYSMTFPHTLTCTGTYGTAVIIFSGLQNPDIDNLSLGYTPDILEVT